MRKRPTTPQTRQIGLARTLSKIGFCSRSQATGLIRAGRVAVNGVVRRDPEWPVVAGARVAVDGRDVAARDPIYLAMNKPRGLVTTASDERGRPTVYSLLSPDLPWVAPAGRLDQASEGLLLFTNDSEWAARITSPSSHVEKVYRVQIASVAGGELITRLQSGVEDRGELLTVVRAAILRTGQKNSWIEVVLDEGRNRHLRRMFAAMGIEVLRLVRVAIGPLLLGSLARGRVRPLSSDEKMALDAALGYSSS